MTNLNDIAASVQAMADDLEEARAHIDMLYRKRRQEASHLTSERVSNGMVRDQLDASRKAIVELQVKCTEELNQRDERIAELEKQLRTAKNNADFWRNQADHWEDAARS